MTHPVKRASAIVGSQRALASMLDIDPSFVSQWVSGHRKVPPNYCGHIEAMTDGAVTREQLRPDIFGPPAEGAAA